MYLQRSMLSESSRCLDLSESVNRYPLSRTHFDMNNSGKASEEAFQPLSEEIENMIQSSAQLVLARCEGGLVHRISELPDG